MGNSAPVPLLVPYYGPSTFRSQIATVLLHFMMPFTFLQYKMAFSKSCNSVNPFIQLIHLWMKSGHKCLKISLKYSILLLNVGQNYSKNRRNSQINKTPKRTSSNSLHFSMYLELFSCFFEMRAGRKYRTSRFDQQFLGHCRLFYCRKAFLSNFQQ